jgi:prepilin-type N-terminal cleavage/methylation domain-containing protein
MRKSKGFTLIELLVVIAIIALLVSILLPSLNRAKELAKRAMCGTNQNGIGKSLLLYTSENDGSPPWINYGPSSQCWATTGGVRTAPSDPDNAARNVSGLLFMLVRDGTAAKLFVCPSTEDTAETDLKDSSGDYYWDFSSNEHISYGYQCPIIIKGTNDWELNWSVATPGSVVVMGDKGPYANSGGSSSPADVTNLTGDALKPHMSPNHSQEINVALFADGHVAMESRPDIGYSSDNIYTDAGNDDTNLQSGSTTSAGNHELEVDTFLLGPRP